MKIANYILFSILMLPVTTFGSEVVLSFSDSAATNTVIKVLKTDSERVFSQCKASHQKIVEGSCVEINRISFKIYNKEEGRLSRGNIASWEAVPEIIGTSVGAAVAFIPAITVAAILADYGTGKKRPRARVVFAVILGAGAAIGYLIGDAIDGEEFSALESVSVRSAIVHPEILEPENNMDLYFDIPLSIYRQALTNADRALSSRD